MIPFFTNFECEKSLPWQKLVEALDKGMMRFSTGGVVQPVRAMLPVPKHNGYVGMMPCYSGFENIIACKIISLYSDNKKFGLPTIIVFVLLFDAETGNLMAFMEGESITKRRTAATSALSARHLANPNPKKLAVLGAGIQALSHIQVLINMFPSIDEISLWNHRVVTAAKLGEQVSGWQPDKTLNMCTEVADCVNDADLIVTATFAKEPVLMAEWVKPGAHVMAVGACVPDMQEIDPELMKSSQVFVDSEDGAKEESGDIILSGCNIQAELGSVIAGEKNGRFGSEYTSVYKSLGLAVQDLVAAKMVYDISPEGFGTQLTFRLIENSELEDYARDLFLDFDEVADDEPVSTGLTGGDISMQCTAMTHGDPYSSCVIQTGPQDGSSTSYVTLVYNAQTGQLLGLIQGHIFPSLSKAAKLAVLKKVFPMQ